MLGSGKWEKFMVQRRILIHALKSGQTASGRSYSYGEFYTVDPMSHSVKIFRSGPLVNDSALTSTVALESFIFILGGRPPSDDELQQLSRECGSHVHSKTSYFDLESPTDSWKNGPPMNFHMLMPDCVPFDGKIYSFGGTESFGEVFDPNHGEWDVLSQRPPYLPESSLRMNVSSPLIPDPSRNRIIVHSKDTSSLLAYYPDQGTWDCLVYKKFWIWSKLAAIVDDVIYLHFPDKNRPFKGYDLSSKKWLKVDLSPEVNVDLISSKFDALLNLGYGNLHLALSSHDDDALETHIVFVKFMFNRPSSKVAQATLISTKKFVIDCSCSVTNYTLI